MYRHHARGFYSQSLKSFSFKSLINIGGAILVLMAVPLNCLFCSNMFFLKIYFANTIRKSVENPILSCM